MTEDTAAQDEQREQTGLALKAMLIPIFFVLMFALSLSKEFHRIFEYHGAEHKVVFNFESRKPVTVENAQQFTTFHPRCGTSFLFVVILVSVVFYMFIPFQAPFLLFEIATSTIQAFVFTLLSTVYIAMMLPHDDHKSHGHAEPHSAH